LTLWKRLPRWLRRPLNRPRIAILLWKESRTAQAKLIGVAPLSLGLAWDRAEVIALYDYGRNWTPADNWLRPHNDPPPQPRIWGAEP